MKKPPTRRAVRAALLLAGLLLGIPALTAGILSIPARPPRPAAAPRVEAAAAGKGPLSAGAAEVAIALPPGAPIGGFPHLDYASAAAEPVFARALVLSAGGRTVALLALEVVVLPEALERAIRARVREAGLDGLVVAATHTHAGPGGYWEHAAGERAATGPYDPALRDALANAGAEALRRAAEGLRPARLSVQRGRAEPLGRSRSGGPRDGSLTVLQLDRPDGTPVGELVIFPAHPTTLGKRNRTISGDWPGRLAAAGGGRGVRLVLQGAGGDQAVALPDSAVVTPDAFAAALGAAVLALPPAPAEAEIALGYARAEVDLPAPAVAAVPALLARAAANLAWDLMPATAEVAAVRLGPVLLAAVPGEPVSEAGPRLREAAGPGAEVLGLAGGYVGYVERPETMRRGGGETKRTYYGPELLERLAAGIEAAAAAARGERPAKAAGPVTRPAAARPSP